MRLLTRLAILACGVLAGAGSQGANTQARLLLAAEEARPGDTVLAGVQLRSAAGWHTYWRNGGDSGKPTEIAWKLPPGVTAGEILWPVPEKYTDTAAEQTTYVYHGEVVLLVPLTLGTNLAAGTLDLQARVDWLECKELCLPGKGEVRARLRVGAAAKPSADADIIEAAQKKLPRREPRLAARAWWEKAAVDDARPLLIEWTPLEATAGGDFFPYGGDGFEVDTKTELVPAPEGKTRLRKIVRKFEGDWPKEFGGLIVERASAERQAAYEVQLAVAPSLTGDARPAGPGKSRLVMLGLAFLGGLILNIMPCVLPVIALKILGFVQQSREAPRRVAMLGLVYALGVLVSFLVLAGVVIAVQQAGRAASWGMQFQNPQFVVVITTIVTLVALNLFGVFEVTLGGGALNAASGLAAQHGAGGAFFNGVLATVLATPCTAPFLTVALGFAFAQPPAVIVLMFLVMGLGLATPYVVLSFAPRLLRALPRPGPWMEAFKVAMGFPMLATALWLLTLTQAHFGSRGPLWVGLFLVMLALAAWVWGRFVQQGRRRKGLAVAIAALLALAGYGYALERELTWRSPAPVDASSGGLKHEPGGIEWQAWSAAAVEQARAQGRPVLVDFTADWCLTCQANKKTSLEIPSVREKLKAINAVALLGDYTRGDEAIAAELKRFERAGVPLVLVYPKRASDPPVILPALLTPGLVLEALEKAGR
jgi:thiol:disulfide interchange protein DsbD